MQSCVKVPHLQENSLPVLLQSADRVALLLFQLVRAIHRSTREPECFPNVLS